MMMKVTAKLLLGMVALAGINLSTAQAEEFSQNVVELTAENFAEKTAEGIWLIDFYGPSCGFCNMLKPTWNSLADQVVEQGNPEGLNIGALNVREARDITAGFKIGKLPGIRLVRDGANYTFPDARQPRPVDEYVEYALMDYEDIAFEEEQKLLAEKKRKADIEANSDVVKLDPKDFEKVTSEGNWLIDFFGPKCGYSKAIWPTLEELATEATKRGVDFKVAKLDATKAATMTRNFEANPWPALRYLKDGKVYKFPDSRNLREIDEYIAWAEGGYLEDHEDEPFIPKHIEAKQERQRKREERRRKRLEAQQNKDEL